MVLMLFNDSKKEKLRVKSLKIMAHTNSVPCEVYTKHQRKRLSQNDAQHGKIKKEVLLKETLINMA